MDYEKEIKKIINELGIDIDEQIKAEELGGPFDDGWIKSQNLKLQVREELRDIVDRLEYIHERE